MPFYQALNLHRSASPNRAACAADDDDDDPHHHKDCAAAAAAASVTDGADDVETEAAAIVRKVHASPALSLSLPLPLFLSLSASVCIPPSLSSSPTRSKCFRLVVLGSNFLDHVMVVVERAAWG
jgi:hypothetical protein